MEASSSLSEAQDMALSILPCFTSLLSCFGSAQIIFMVLTGRKTTPYRRIVLGLSVSDFLCSVIYPWQAFLLPQDTSPRIWAIGNQGTCSFLGFGQQIFFASICYNSMLSLYFLLTVRFGISNPQVAKRYEPWMHLVSIGYPLVTACVGAGVGVFQELELGHGCWVEDYPEGCDVCDKTAADNNCAACTDYIFAFFFGGLPAILAFIMIVANNILVYLHVRNTIQKVRRRFKSSTQHGISSAAASASATSSANNTSGTRRSSMFAAKRSISAAIRRRFSASGQPADPQLQRIRAVAKQACWYVAAFMMTYTSSCILRILAAFKFDARDEAKLFPLLVLQAVLLPCQGWFNLFVYIRPSFWRTRRDYPHESYWWVFRRALYGERIQPVKDEAKRRPSSSDFGLMVVHRLHVTQGRSILHTYGMQNMYDPYWSGGEIVEENAVNNEAIEEVASFAGDNPLSRRSDDVYYSGDDNDEDLAEDASSTEGGDRPASFTAGEGPIAASTNQDQGGDAGQPVNDKKDKTEVHDMADEANHHREEPLVQGGIQATEADEQQLPPAVEEHTG